jgi:hypothetical protein
MRGVGQYRNVDCMLGHDREEGAIRRWEDLMDKTIDGNRQNLHLVSYICVF